MFLSRRFVFRLSQMTISSVGSQKARPFPTLQKLNGSLCECHRKFHGSAWKMKDKLSSSMPSESGTFTEEASPFILDIEEEREKIGEEEIKDEFEGYNLQRGTTGVFDIEEIVELLKREKAQDIFVVRIPPEANYADYMVIVTGRSKRQMLALFEFIRKVFKRKMSSSDIIPKTEGKSSKDWMAIDLGNIVVHMLSKHARKTYDLESLWSLGRDHDVLYQRKSLSETSFLSDYESVLAKLIPDSKHT